MEGKSKRTLLPIQSRAGSLSLFYPENGIPFISLGKEDSLPTDFTVKLFLQNTIL